MGRLIDPDERVAAAREKQAAEATASDPRSDGGAVDFDNWPDAADSRNLLSENAKKVIETAAVEKDATYEDIAEKTGVCVGFVSQILRAHYAERTHSPPALQEDDQIDRWRQELVHGRTTTEKISSNLNTVSRKALPVRLRSEQYGTLPPVEYDFTESESGEWMPKFGEIPEPGDTPHPAAEFDCRLGRLDATTDLTTDAEGDCLEAEPDETPGLLGRTIAAVRGLL
jgi:hypothetical protein